VETSIYALTRAMPRVRERVSDENVRVRDCEFVCVCSVLCMFYVT